MASADAAEADSPLPAPLLFLDEQGQLQRLARDGRSVTTLVQAAGGVIAYDYAPSSGRLATLQLLAPADTLVVGPEQAPQTAQRMRLVLHDAAMSETIVNTPYVPLSEPQIRWSTDGRFLAYPTVDGVLIYDAETGDAGLTLAAPAPTAEMMTLYDVVDWSSDGDRLLLRAFDVPGFGWRLLVADVGSGALVELQQWCCHPSWSTDGTAVYLDGSAYPHGILGLYRVDAATGATAPLLGGNVDVPPFVHVFFPQEIGGVLHFFYDERLDPTSPDPLVMMADPRTAPLRYTAALNLSRVYPVEVAWRHEGAAVRDADGRWLWLPFAGETLIPLPISGTGARWMEG